MARRVAVAFSGGRDSTALLHATRAAGAALGIEVLAFHVHHGLQPDADRWLEHCRRLCARWKLRFDSVRLQSSPPAGESVEAWARGERYSALAAMARAHDTSLVLLGQHRRDQAETFLLQALRGAGVAGLAAMPELIERDGITWARPWLGQPRRAIEAYLHRHRLRCIEDTSNADPRYARNRLRVDVWPALTGSFPHAEASLADAAQWSAQASALIDSLADADLALLESNDELDVERWQRLDPLRRRNALRRWLQRNARLSSSAIERLALELPGKRSACWPGGEGTQLRLYRGRLRVVASGPRRPVAESALLRIDGPGEYALPEWHGRLVVERVDRGGVALSLLASLRAVARRGGERFQFGPHSTPRSLKKQFQSRSVPSWQRDGPLLYAGERLVFVPGLGIDARARAETGEPQFGLRWVGEGGR